MPRLRAGPEDQTFARRLVLTVFTAALILFVYKASDLLLLVFGAMLAAVLFSTVADWIAGRTPLPRGGALAVAVLLFFALLGLMGWLFSAEISSQAEKLGQHLPQDWQQIQAGMTSSPVGRQVLPMIQLSARSSGVLRYALGIGWGAGEVLVNFIIIVVGAIFFAAQPGIYQEGLVRLVPPAYRDVARDAVDDVGRALRLWLLTQVVSMVMMGIMIGLGLWWSGVEAPASLGLLGGLSEFIPYVGPTLAMIPAIIVGLAGKGSIVGVLVTYLVVRIVQANIITPLISHRLVSVPPGLYLFLILSAGYAFGTFGLFFSGALSVTAYTLGLRLWGRETLGDEVKMPGEQ